MQLLFGKRFFETVLCLNLLEAAKPSLQSERAGKTKGIQLILCNIAINCGATVHTQCT